ncbi:MAG: NAD-dependent epimerase/dehydratase family protein, partial [Anaerolineaceae bacterium]|nr:NAD-dependent epimerase/dehydratase family protein [Anaerolineaceae bacterium]
TRLVYTSSIHALRREPHGVVITEDVPFDPSNPLGAYDRSKAEASLAVLEAARNGLDAVIVCPTGVIGPHDYRKSEMGQLIAGWMTRKSHLIVDGGYDFVDVRDAAQGLILAMQKGKSGEVYILSGEHIQLARIREIVLEAFGGRSAGLFVPTWVARLAALFSPFYYRITRSQPRFTSYSIETVLSNSLISHAKATRELGYTPRTLQQSIQDTVNWWREQGWRE